MIFSRVPLGFSLLTLDDGRQVADNIGRTKRSLSTVEILWRCCLDDGFLDNMQEKDSMSSTKESIVNGGAYCPEK